MPTATPFNNLITFSRGSNATVTGSNGLIQWAPNNLLTFSEQFDNAAWVKTAVTATANSTVAPNGTTTADTITASAGAGYHYAAQNAAVVAGTTYTASMYVRAGTARYIGFGDAGDAVWHSAYLDTTDGSILNQVNCVATAVSVGGGWFLVTSTFTRTNAANAQIYVGGSTVTGNAGPVFTAAGTETCIAWGAQLELGSTATTYNPTTVKNLLGFSEAFDNAAFTKLRASIVTGAQANPVNGLFNAQKLMEDTTASNTHLISQGPTLAAAPHVLSVYVKAAGRNWFALVNNSIANVSAFFDLANGVVGTVGSAATASITNVGSGWYRCSMAFTAIAATNNLHFRLASANGTDSYTGDGNSGVYIYGAQLSDSASLDPYVPTPGAAPSSTAFYGPRFDFDPVALQPRGLLVEEARTNLTLRSEEFDNASWSKVQLNTTGTPAWVNQTASPDGLTTADKLIPTAVSAQHYVAQAATVTAAAHTLTAYAKAAEYGFCVLSFYGATTTVSDKYAVFNLSTGAATDVAAGVTASAVNAGNGWYRLSITFTMLAAASVTQYIFASNASTYAGATFTGNGTSGIFVWGAQLEAGAFATSYIPTVASTVTRSADVATITGQNFAQWYRQDEGVIAADTSTFKPTAVGGSVIIAEANDNTLNNRNILFYTAADVRGRTAVAGVTQAEISQAYVANATDKLAYAYRVNDFAFARNGGLVGTDTTGTVPVVDRFMIGGFGANASLNGHIRNIRFIPARAADFQLQALST